MSNREPLNERDVLLRPERAPAAPPPAEQEYLQIGEVAERTGLTQRTLRYYEELQLLAAPTRTAGDFRLYSPADVARIQHILRLKQLLGFSLAEIKAIIRAEDGPGRGPAAGDDATSARRRLEQINHVLANTSGQLVLLKRKIAEMELLRDDLVARWQDLERQRAALVAEQEGALAHAASEYS
ncbi:MAG TPA: MerR family transcriptional regulator [Chloroflexia bacterium]|nr:MerR family transcriptional regulator [Chloroflexia bacterium]